MMLLLAIYVAGVFLLATLAVLFWFTSPHSRARAESAYIFRHSIAWPVVVVAAMLKMIRYKGE